MSWPPDVRRLKGDLGIEPGDTRDDARLQEMLDAATAFVAHVLAARFTFTGAPTVALPAPSEDIVLGTVRLAGRWHTRRRSPDGLIVSSEFGTSRIPSFDADIERLLRIGRYAPAVFA